MKITTVKIAEVRIPLPQPLRLGAAEIKTRDYVVLRMTTDAGVFGEAVGFSRGTQLKSVLEAAGNALLGKNPLMRGAIISGFDIANVPGTTSFVRARSLIDIALWDIASKVARLPLYQMLGGSSDCAPVTGIAGYYSDNRTATDIADEVETLGQQGHLRVKIMLRGDDIGFDRQSLEECLKRSGMPEIAGDAHWTWRNVTEATRACRLIDTFGLSFIEDPLPPSLWRATHKLQLNLATPIAAGEDMIDSLALGELAAGIGVLRVDATSCGGITAAVQAIHYAAAAGCAVLPHVFAPLHLHLACAFTNVEGVELISRDVGADPIFRIVENYPDPRHGQLHVDDEPGVGIRVDWDEIEHLQTGCTVIQDPG